MAETLIRHPASAGGEGLRIEAAAERGPSGRLSLRYTLSGAVAEVRLPEAAAPQRTDELWRRTCFEVFLATAAGYVEFNFAPSTQWAAYRFDGYRSGMAPLELAPPAIAGRAEEGRYELLATAVLDPLGDLPHDAPWRVALSAVVEGLDGRRSYWALAHPSAQPDFHHLDSFVLSLSPAARP